MSQLNEGKNTQTKAYCILIIKKIMVMFDIEIISIEIVLVSAYYKITENTIPLNKDSSMRGG